MDNSADEEFRAAAITFVRDLSEKNVGLVSRPELESFTFHGNRIPLVERQKGIRKVAGLDAAISMMTTYVSDPTKRPYADEAGPDGYQRYKWQGTDRNLAANRSLRTAMELGKPLIWFFGVGVGLYRPFVPVWLIDEEPDQHQFVLAVDEDTRDQWTAVSHPVDMALRREYVEATIRRRVHQPVFRDRVLLAYEKQCALCHLRHTKLLDAAHIKEDSAGGEPVVPNGVAMCAIHHRAFDANVIGIRPDYIIEVQPRVLEESDGPTLRHALQGVHKTSLFVPRQRKAQPDALLLEERYARFRQAG